MATNDNTLVTTDDFNFRFVKISNRIKYLTFGEKFNQEIYPGELPEELVELNFGKKFNN